MSHRGGLIVAISAAFALSACNSGDVPATGSSTAAGTSPTSPVVSDTSAPATSWVGDWYGHTRRLTITADGRVHELISSGCCQLYADVRYRILPTTERVTAGGRSISLEVTAVTVGNVRVGQSGLLRMSGNQVFSGPTGGTNYCGPRAAVGECGA